MLYSFNRNLARNWLSGYSIRQWKGSARVDHYFQLATAFKWSNWVRKDLQKWRKCQKHIEFSNPSRGSVWWHPITIELKLENNQLDQQWDRCTFEKAPRIAEQLFQQGMWCLMARQQSSCYTEARSSHTRLSLAFVNGLMISSCALKATPWMAIKSTYRLCSRNTQLVPVTKPIADVLRWLRFPREGPLLVRYENHTTKVSWRTRLRHLEYQLS